MAGRVPDLEKDDQITIRVCKYIRLGCTIEDACEAAGVGKSTYYQWLEKARGESPKPCYVEFADSVTRALHEAKVALVGMVHAAAYGETGHDRDGNPTHKPGDWRAAAYLLSCRDPENYSVRKRFEHSGPGGQPLEVQVYDRVRLPAPDPDEDGDGEDG